MAATAGAGMGWAEPKPLESGNKPASIWDASNTGEGLPVMLPCKLQGVLSVSLFLSLSLCVSLFLLKLYLFI